MAGREPNEVLLLGAGASVEAGVPAAYEMSRVMLQKFQEDIADRKSAKILAFVIGGLIFGESKVGNNPFTTGVNVEALFNAIDLLAKRNTLEAAPFIAAWDSMIEEFDRYEPSSFNSNSRAFLDELGKQINSSMKSVIENARNNRLNMSSNTFRPLGLDQKLEAVINRTPKPANGRVFESVNQKMLRTLRHMVLVTEESRVNYFRPLFKSTKPLIIATLNYDNSIEFAAEKCGWSWSDRLNEWNNDIPIMPTKLESRSAYLLKLHGSIQWEWAPRVPHVPPTPFSSVPHANHDPFTTAVCRRVNNINPQTGYLRPCVLFGGTNKLTHEGPFLDLLRAFESSLHRASHLTIIGYSFRDPHINIQIVRWLRKSISHVFRIVDPNFSKSNLPFIQELKHFKDQHHNRLEIHELPVNLTDIEYTKRIKTFTGDTLRSLYSKRK